MTLPPINENLRAENIHKVLEMDIIFTLACQKYVSEKKKKENKITDVLMKACHSVLRGASS